MTNDKGEPSFLDFEKELFDQTIGERLAVKHRRPIGKEVEMVNSLPIAGCPFCGSAHTRMDGRSKKTGLRMRECASCGRKFSPLTGTIFDSRKIPISEWFEYLAHLFMFHSVRTSSESNMNADSTGLYWLAKVFMVLDGHQDGTWLSGTVWIDETYVPKWPSLTRALGDGLRPRGLSTSQLCVATAVDGASCYLKACGEGNPSAKDILDAYSGHIAPSSTVIHDGLPAHRKFISSIGGEDIVWPSEETKGLPDARNPMEPVNKVHRLLKKFMSRHGGYGRGRLQDWLNLFAFYFNTPGKPFEKANEFVKYAIEKRGVLRYRDWAGVEKDD